jgi:hypothetical protein
VSLVAALERVAAARRYLHAETCHGPDFPCLNCPAPIAVAAALDLLDGRPRDARGARRVFHDARCASGCGPDSDHADRTQAATAAALRRFRAQERQEASA